MLLRARVYGDPRPQGSKRGFATKTGKVAMVESAGEGLKTWRARVAAAIAEGRPGGGPWDVPVHVSVVFYVRRPKRPKFPVPGTRPDLDKFLRGLLDAITGVWIRDDGQVAEIEAAKVYESPAEPVGALVTIYPALDFQGQGVMTVAT